MKFYKVSLTDVNEKKPLVAYDPSVEDEKYMRKAKDETADLDDTPKWPSGMDVIKREGLAILTDLTHDRIGKSCRGVEKRRSANERRR